MSFKPNELKQDDVDALSDWQLLIAACHFGPTMRDCVDLDYEYRFDETTNEAFLVGSGPRNRDISLKGDFDLENPEESLSRYAGIDLDWRDIARQRLKQITKERGWK